jgi:hypothetical protein
MGTHRIAVLAVGALLLGAWGATFARAGEEDKKEKEPESGTVVGTVTKRGENWVEVKPDGEKASRRYMPNWKADEDQKDSGTFDKEMLAKIIKVSVNSRVKIAWKLDAGQRRIQSIEILPPDEKSGTVTGVIVTKGTDYVDVKDENGAVERYVPRASSGTGKDAGTFDKEMVKTIAQFHVGDKVSVDWTFEDRRRVTRIAKIN